MIQRLQSLYLLIVFVLLGMMFFLPFAVFNDGSGSITYMAYKGIVKINPTGWITITKNYIIASSLIVSMILVITTIFSFKSRKNQIKLGWGIIVVLLFTSIYLFYNYFWTKSHFGILNSSLNLASTFPVVSIILTLLSINAIKKDEKLVKSMDRIR